MDLPPSPIPEIHIFFAPPEERIEDSYSPFNALSPLLAEEDGYRPSLLSPPSTASAKQHRPLSPLRPVESVITGKGLDRDRFEALLKASREKNVSVGAKRSPDLRKEIALKAHRSKQMERRAIFLSKVHAPPSPTAMSLPKTPPESPAIFHYTLPSPGLMSPLAVFESLHDDPLRYPSQEPWVEQVDYGLPKEFATKVKPSVKASQRAVKPLPSLDQISARLSSHGHVPIPHVEPAVHRRSPIPLPAFLQAKAQPKKLEPSVPLTTTNISTETSKSRRTLPTGVGRLKFPVRAEVPPVQKPLPPTPQHQERQMLPRSPGAPLTPTIEIRTTVVPRTSTASPVNLTESNLQALSARARTASDMLSTLRRRTLEMHLDAHSAHALNGYDHEEDRKSGRRRSAPAEMVKREQRTGFMHPMLALPGGF